MQTCDDERLYDPCAYHDRLLLGLSGIMSEAESHQIKQRLHQGERQKAARGELRLPVPAGLAHGRSGKIILNPDEQVQASLGLVFAKFRELHSARAVMRYLRKNDLPLPMRHSSARRRTMLCDARRIAHACSVFSKILPMPERMSMVAGGWKAGGFAIRARASAGTGRIDPCRPTLLAFLPAKRTSKGHQIRPLHAIRLSFYLKGPTCPLRLA
jgi:hypothetical protein